ncbi:MAG: MBOAT family protein [Termitinemataceae bacterium]|nr:MAG: MBOAT family protein [Termitinemataceae bacterium]
MFSVLLPVGISFYTFQALSYTVDVYRNEISVEKNFAKYALFVSFFPQLVAGPIERSKNLLSQISEKHYFSFDRVKSGLLLMLWGFFEKIVIADRVAILVNNVFNNYTNYEGFQIIIASVLFGIQIYCDFAGYSDIAIGAAEIMGFRLISNFRQPYFAQSIKDFWRRWHISLTTWFRDYLYIPLGGSRCSKKRRYVNTMIVFLTSGLWHGASWHFVVWGALHGLYQVIGDILRPIKQRINKQLHINVDQISFKLGKILITFILVDIAWIFFRANSLRDALRIGKRILNLNPWIFFDGSIYNMGLNRLEFNIALVSILILIFVNSIQYKYQNISIRTMIMKENIVFQYAFYLIGIFSVLIFGIYGPEYNASQFIYFQF